MDLVIIISGFSIVDGLVEVTCLGYLNTTLFPGMSFNATVAFNATAAQVNTAVRAAGVAAALDIGHTIGAGKVTLLGPAIDL